MSTIKVDTIATRTGSGNITVSNTTAGTSATLSGTLGVISDRVYLEAEGSHSVYLDASENNFNPGSATGTDNDGNIDLGASFARWKDLYISGGLYVGGTGAANKLDDYEEGTWVPVVKDTSGGSAYTYASHYEFRLPGLTSSTNALPYTKIGNRVFITFSIWWNTTANTRYNISLPFAYDGSAYGLCGSATPYNISTDSGLGILGTISNVANFDTYAVTSSGGHGTVPYSSSSEVYYFINYVVA